MILQQNSDNQQGFIETKLQPKIQQINTNKSEIRKNNQKQQKNLFTPYYLYGSGYAIKQEIPQAIQPFKEFQIKNNNEQDNIQTINNQINNQINGQSLRKSIKSTNGSIILNSTNTNINTSNFGNTNHLKSKQPLSSSIIEHPYHLYGNSSSFQLIYSKNSSDQPIFNEFQYIKNNIVLKTSIKVPKQTNKHHEFIINQSMDRILNKKMIMQRNQFSRQVKKNIEEKTYNIKNNNIQIMNINTNLSQNKNIDQNNRPQSPLDIRVSAQSIQANNSIILNQSQIKFDSRFQCGNLHCCYLNLKSNLRQSLNGKNYINNRQYHLFLQNDTNSYGYNQWFYFSMENVKKDLQYTIKIVNLKKYHSFFKNGYQPIIFSKKRYYQSKQNKQCQKDKINGEQIKSPSSGWYRAGYNIQYYQSNFTVSKFFKFYTLSFNLRFEHDNDFVYIASNLPYSYTKLIKTIQNFTENFKKSNQIQQVSECKVSSLTRTFCGNNVPEIKLIPKIMSKKRKSLSPQKNRGEINNEKKMIIFLARQHPGQTVSSYLMEQILNNFASFGLQKQKIQRNKSKYNKKAETQTKQQFQNAKIRYLVQNFTIVIYPMINIDGVIYGNSRCDITGMDLNRRWHNPSKLYHSQIYYIKSRIQQYINKYKYNVVACFDLHGHSKEYDIFGYGCKINNLSCRILSYILSKQCEQFYFPKCTFGISRYKATTARAAIFRMIKNQNVLTIESSYWGFINRNLKEKEKQIEKSKQKQAYTLTLNYNFTQNQKTALSVSLKSIQTQEKNYNTLSLQRQKPINRSPIQYFQPKTFQQMAFGILNGISIFLNKEDKEYKETQKQIKENIAQILSYQTNNQENQDGNQKEQDSGSQSDPEGDQIDFKTKINNIFVQNSGENLIQEQAKCFQIIEETNIPQSLNEQIKLIQRQYNSRLQKIKQSEQNFELEHSKTADIVINPQLIAAYQQQNDEQKKLSLSQSPNKIRIKKRKDTIKDSNRFISIQKTKKDIEIMEQKQSQMSANSNKRSLRKSKPVYSNKVSKKQTISFSLQKNSKLNSQAQHQNQRKGTSYDNKGNIYIKSSLKHNIDQTNQTPQKLYISNNKSKNKKKILFSLKNGKQSFMKQKAQHSQFYDCDQKGTYDDLVIYSSNSKDIYYKNAQKQDRINPNQQCLMKFQKIIPTYMQNLQTNNQKRQKLTYLQQSIYKDDQRDILNTLLQNKKKLQNQKLKREIQKSNFISERQGKLRFSAHSNLGNIYHLQQQNNSKLKKEQIIDYKKFKQQQKFKVQLRQTHETYAKYLQPHIKDYKSHKDI